MDPRLPPLNALRTFVVAARTRSFAKASTELSVTPAAVSRSIRSLEDYLGFPLFRRMHRSIELTGEGRQYFKDLDDVFDRITLSTQNLMAQRPDQPLVVCAYPSFIVNWLVPRWSRQLQSKTNIQLKMVTTLSHDIDFEATGIHLALLTDRSEYAGCISTRLFLATLVPVCRPDYLPPGTTARDVEEWQNALLHSETRPNDWDRWSAANGIPIDTSQGVWFENAPMMYEAAISGLGIGIGIKEVLSRNFATQRLAIAFPDNVEASCPFYLIRPPTTEKHPYFQPFVNWLTQEVRADAEKSRAV